MTEPMTPAEEKAFFTTALARHGGNGLMASQELVTERKRRAAARQQELMAGGAGGTNDARNRQMFGEYSRLADAMNQRGYQPSAAETALGNQLAAEAQGTGIGQQLIRQQAQSQADRGVKQQISQAASARPGQSALATRQAMMNAGNINSQVGGQSSMAVGQHQLGAIGAQGQFLNAQNSTRLQQMGLNDAAQMEMLRQRLMLTQGDAEGQRWLYGQLYGNKGDSGPSTGQRILGAAGAVAGGIYAGPKGAAVGYQVGNEAGKGY